jgi:hypothetical protein
MPAASIPVPHYQQRSPGSCLPASRGWLWYNDVKFNRVLYAFDPRRTAILLIGGKKVGHDRWYDEYVPIADRLYEGNYSASFRT